MDEELLLESDVPTRTYKVVNGRIVGYVDSLDAMRQAVEKVLLTERFEYDIYTANYGVEFSDLIGESMDLVKAEIERVVAEALTVDDRITSIDNFEILSETKNTMLIRFDVATIFGVLVFKQEVSV